MNTSLLKSSAADSAFSSSSIPPRPEEELAEEVRQIHEAVTQEEIARRAYEIWEQAGCPHGSDQEHWLAAERQLHGASSLFDSPKANRAGTEVDARAQARTIKASAERRERTRASQ